MALFFCCATKEVLLSRCVSDESARRDAAVAVIVVGRIGLEEGPIAPTPLIILSAGVDPVFNIEFLVRAERCARRHRVTADDLIKRAPRGIVF
jgi:hypothetical protein